MARQKSSMTFGGYLEVEAAAPLDGREVVPTKEDLTDASNFPFAYEGLTVYVKSEKKSYTLTGNDVTVAANWKEIGSGSGSGEGSGSVTVDDTLSDTSENPVQNKVIKEALDNKQNKLTLGTGLDFDYDSGKLEATNAGAATTSMWTNSDIGGGYSVTTYLEDDENGARFRSRTPYPQVFLDKILVDKEYADAIIPAGGTTGQALIKASNDDGDVEWGNVSGGGGTNSWSAALSDGYLNEYATDKLSTIAGDFIEEVDWDKIFIPNQGDDRKIFDEGTLITRPINYVVKLEIRDPVEQVNGEYKLLSESWGEFQRNYEAEAADPQHNDENHCYNIVSCNPADNGKVLASYWSNYIGVPGFDYELGGFYVYDSEGNVDRNNRVKLYLYEKVKTNKATAILDMNGLKKALGASTGTSYDDTVLSARVQAVEDLTDGLTALTITLTDNNGVEKTYELLGKEVTSA